MYLFFASIQLRVSLSEGPVMFFSFVLSDTALSLPTCSPVKTQNVLFYTGVTSHEENKINVT